VIQEASFLFIGTTEIMFILFIVVMVFGADKIPEIARGMGKGMRMLKNATNTYFDPNPFWWREMR